MTTSVEKIEKLLHRAAQLDPAECCRACGKPNDGRPECPACGASNECLCPTCHAPVLADHEIGQARSAVFRAVRGHATGNFMVTDAENSASKRAMKLGRDIEEKDRIISDLRQENAQLSLQLLTDQMPAQRRSSGKKQTKAKSSAVAIARLLFCQQVSLDAISDQLKISKPKINKTMWRLKPPAEFNIKVSDDGQPIDWLEFWELATKVCGCDRWQRKGLIKLGVQRPAEVTFETDLNAVVDRAKLSAMRRLYRQIVN